MKENDFDISRLVSAALDNLPNSYAPYSHFNVSAALLASSGKIYTGVNVENASYPAGVCAESNAVYGAVGCGEREFVAIAIAGGPYARITSPCPPCGICRQVLREFCDPRTMKVILVKSATEYRECTLEDLLPHSFGPGSLSR